MAILEHWYDQDLKKPVKVHHISGNVFSMDNLANRIGVRVYDNGEAVTLSGSVSANVIRPDGGTVAVTGSLSGNQASVTLPQAAYAYPGMIAIVLKLTSGSTVTTLCAVTAIVYRSATDTIIDPGTIIPDIQALISQIQTAVESIPLDYSALNQTVRDLYITRYAEATPLDIRWSETNGYLKMADGNVQSSDAFSVSGFRSIPAYTVAVVFTCPVSANETRQQVVASVAFYSSNAYSAWISSANIIAGDADGTQWKIVQVPEGATHIKHCTYVGDVSNYKLAFIKSDEHEENFVNLSYLGLSLISDNDDLDNYTTPGNYRCDSASTAQSLSNCPVTIGFRLSIYNLVSPSSTYQEIRTVSEGVWWRALVGGAWSEWYCIGKYSVREIGKRQTQGDTVLTDCNNALSNRIYTTTTAITNSPDGKMGTLFTFNGDSSYESGQAQMFVSRYGEVYTRIKWGGSGGTWTAWQQTETMTTSGYYSGIGMFERFGIIGDSFASGFIYTTKTPSGTERYQLSWGQILARQEGNVCVNYSKGGYNTYAFVQQNDSAYNTYGLGKVLDDINNGHACDLYLLCLGINDSSSSRTFGDKTGGLNYLGSSADIKENPDNNENSFWGNYGRIISAIKTASPYSRIVMCNFKRTPTTATAEGYDAFRTAIGEIAEYFELPSIKLDDDIFFNSTFYMNQMVGSHPTAPQNVGYAKAINRLLSKAIIENYAYFKEYEGI